MPAPPGVDDARHSHGFGTCPRRVCTTAMLVPCDRLQSTLISQRPASCHRFQTTCAMLLVLGPRRKVLPRVIDPRAPDHKPAHEFNARGSPFFFFLFFLFFLFILDWPRFPHGPSRRRRHVSPPSTIPASSTPATRPGSPSESSPVSNPRSSNGIPVISTNTHPTESILDVIVLRAPKAPLTPRNLFLDNTWTIPRQYQGPVALESTGSTVVSLYRMYLDVSVPSAAYH